METAEELNVTVDLVETIVQRLLDVSQPDRIILFGSAARGRMTPDSDIDLLVLEASPSQPRRQIVRLRNALRGLGYPFDVMVMATEKLFQVSLQAAAADFGEVRGQQIAAG